VSSSALLIDGPPTCSIRNCGCACWTRAVSSRSGCTRSEAVFGSPDMVIGNSSAPLSRDGIGAPTEATPSIWRSRAAASSAAAFAALWSSAPARGVISTFSTAG
jgi:hypothetical protein